MLISQWLTNQNAQPPDCIGPFQSYAALTNLLENHSTILSKFPNLFNLCILAKEEILMSAYNSVFLLLLHSPPSWILSFPWASVFRICPPNGITLVKCPKLRGIRHYGPNQGSSCSCKTSLPYTLFCTYKIHTTIVFTHNNFVKQLFIQIFPNTWFLE